MSLQTAPHVLWSHSSTAFNKSIQHLEAIIFPMDHQQLGAAGSNRYSWIRWSCPHATCQKVTNNHIAAHYSLTSLRDWQLAFIHIYAPLFSACFFKHQWSADHLETKKKSTVCVCYKLVWFDKWKSNDYYEKGPYTCFYIWTLIMGNSRLENVYHYCTEIDPKQDQQAMKLPRNQCEWGCETVRVLKWAT